MIPTHCDDCQDYDDSIKCIDGQGENVYDYPNGHESQKGYKEHLVVL